jgi:hypothetical protein
MRKRSVLGVLAIFLAVVGTGGPTLAQAQAPAGLPPSPVKFEQPELPATGPVVGQPFALSLCDPPVTNANDLCGNLTGGTSNPIGGSPPYHFQLDTGGGFLPFGLTLHPNGLITGTPSAAGTRNFRVCAVDLAGYQKCIDYTLDVARGTTEKSARKASKGKGPGMAGVVLLAGAAAGLGVGLAAINQLNTEASCGDPPSIPNSCLGIGRNSTSCNQIIGDYSAWCTCMGRTFSTSTGSCR